MTAQEYADQMASTPEGQTKIRLLRAEAVRNMLNRKHQCRLADVAVAREGDALNISWEVKNYVNDASDVSCSAHSYNVDFFPDVDTFSGNELFSGYRGDGNCTVKLEEGCCCYIMMLWVDTCPKASKELAAVIFVEGVPLTHESRAILRKALLHERNPEERIKHEMDSITKKHEAYDEALRVGIERIKAKKLPPDEEEEKIQDYRDAAAQLRDKLGL